MEEDLSLYTTSKCLLVVEVRSFTSLSLFLSLSPLLSSLLHSTSIGRSGTFCVLSSVLEQLKVEGIVDPFFTIHSLRQQQPGLVQTFVSV